MRQARAAWAWGARSSPDRRQSDEPEQHDWRLAAGPLVERRLTRARCRGITMNGGASWSIVMAGRRRSHRRHTGERRRLPAGDRPVGELRPNRNRLPAELSFNDAAPCSWITAFDFDHALLASRSTNGGPDLERPGDGDQGHRPTVFNDKQTITADPTDANYVYAVWDRLVFSGSERASSSPASQASASAASVVSHSEQPGSRGSRRGRLGSGPATSRRSATRSWSIPTDGGGRSSLSPQHERRNDIR